MGVLTPQTILIKNNGKCKNHYIEKGYEIKSEFYVCVFDLTNSSAYKIICVCDNCGNNFKKARHKIKDMNKETYCKDCYMFASKKSCMEKYGVEFVWQSKEIQNNISKRNIEKYGVKCTLQIQEVKNKAKKTIKEKYGVDNIAKLEKTIKKMKETNMKKYGCEFPIQNKDVRKKIQQTYFKKYSLDFNTSRIACSKNQVIIAEMFGAQINKDIGGYFADIVIENKNIVIEYDGGGHNLPVILGKISEIDFYLKEKKREKDIILHGYKIIRVISPKDSLIDKDKLYKSLLSIVDFLNESKYEVVKVNFLGEVLCFE